MSQRNNKRKLSDEDESLILEKINAGEKVRAFYFDSATVICSLLHTYAKVPACTLQ
jgi:hypothetical protein